MKIKNWFFRDSGFSIVEITVAMGLLGALSLGVMKIMENSQKAAKNIENKDEISQFQNEINDILKNPNNCEATLGSRTENSPVPIIYQIINGVAVPKHVASTAQSAKVSIESMIVKSVDGNGSNGSQSLATLMISFKKPSGSSIGRQVLNKEIKVNASFCNKPIIHHTNLQTLMSMCTGVDKRLIEGPHNWSIGSGAIYWAVCQDCSNASSKIIRFCQSQGSGGGVDVGNISQLSCLSLGGSYEDSTSRCLFPDKTLEELIESKVNALKDTLPASILSETTPTCLSGSVYSLKNVNGKITLDCSPPPPPPPAPSCTGCSEWGAYNVSGTGHTCVYKCGNILREGTRTTCTYSRSCLTKTPAGCVGSVSNSTNGPLTWNADGSGSGKKYFNIDIGRENAAKANCPAAAHFGI